MPVQVWKIDMEDRFFVFVFVIPLPRFLQLCWKGYLEDSRSFNGDPPHLTLNHGFPVIQLSRPKKVAWRLGGWWCSGFLLGFLRRRSGVWFPYPPVLEKCAKGFAYAIFFDWLSRMIGKPWLRVLYCIVYTCTQVLQLYWRSYLEDSRSFNGDPPHLTLNHGFPVIRLSRPKKVA